MDQELGYIVLVALIFLAFYIVGKLSSIDRKLERILSNAQFETQSIQTDAEIQSLIDAGKTNKAIALCAKRYLLPLAEAERLIRDNAATIQKPNAGVPGK